jgi:[FeFe] hydrogenase H-cluster maturation GTPase HydF
VISKADTLTENDISKAKEDFENSIFTSVNDEKSIEELKNIIIKELNSLPEEERGLLDGISKEGDNVILVCPVDSEAPKGRLILPQVQLIRECLDKGIICHVCTVETLPQALDGIKADLVVTDSQAFKEVDEIVPEDIKLTSFSILMARQKGDLSVFNEGLSAVSKLEDEDYILISEVCTHNTSHEDIGRVKIPTLLMKKTGKKLNFEFSSGNSFPDDLEKYKLVIHCGGCMITRKAMCARLGRIKEHNVPAVNFGILLSYLTGAYKRQEWLF